MHYQPKIKQRPDGIVTPGGVLDTYPRGDAPGLSEVLYSDDDDDESECVPLGTGARIEWRGQRALFRLRLIACAQLTTRLAQFPATRPLGHSDEPGASRCCGKEPAHARKPDVADPLAHRHVSTAA